MYFFGHGYCLMNNHCHLIIETTELAWIEGIKSKKT